MPTLGDMAAGAEPPRARGPGVRHAVVVAASLAAGATLVLLVFFRPAWDGGLLLQPRFDLGRFAGRLRENLRWLAPFAAAAALLPALRALVWREVFPAPPPRLVDAYHATALGSLVHNAIPGKLGPLAAAYALSRMGARPFAPALSSQLVAKLMELGAIVTLGATAAALRPSGSALRTVVVAGAAGFAVLAGVAVALAFGAPRLAARLARRLPRAGAALASLGAGLVGAGRPARVVAALALAVLPAAGAALAYALPLRAAGVPASAAGGALVVAVIAFGQFTPGLPIGAGVYWTLSSWAARQLGAAPEDAAALAILTHAGMVGAGIAVGAISAIARRRTFVELLRRRREVARMAEGEGRVGPSRAPGLPRRQGQ